MKITYFEQTKEKINYSERARAKIIIFWKRVNAIMILRVHAPYFISIYSYKIVLLLQENAIVFPDESMNCENDNYRQLQQSKTQ